MAKNIFSGAKDASRAKITICTAFLCAAILLAAAAVFALAGCSAEPDDALLGGSGGSGTSGKIEIKQSPVSPTEPYSVNAPATPLTVEVSAEGVTPKYQWYASEPNSNPVLLTNATDPQYTPETDKIGTFTYFVVVSAADDNAVPQRSAPAIVSVSDAELIINIFGGSIKDGACLRNTTDNTTVNLTSIDPGWATYHLADGTWTLENYTPEGGAVTLSPSNGTVQITMGGKTLISAMVTNSAAGRGKVIVSVNGVTLPANTKLESQGGVKEDVPETGGTFEDLAPDIWWLNGLPNDGEFITDPPSAMVTVYAGATANIGVSAGDPDIDNDGYPSAWEREHRNEGFNPKVPNEPFGIDLSGVGAAPPGITFESNIYTVQNDGLERVYRVYKSDPATQDVNSIVIAAGAKAKLMLDTAGVTLSGGITVNNGAKLILSSMGNVGDKPNVIVPDGASATVTLDGVLFAGGSPIQIGSTDAPAVGANATLLLSGTNTFITISSSDTGILTRPGAHLTIDSAKSSGSPSGAFTIGEHGSGTGYGIMNVGSLTIKGGTLNIFGGSGKASITNILPTSTITIDGGEITANGGDYAAGIGGGINSAAGVITINGGTVKTDAGYSGTGIGTGMGGIGGTITINNGIINATGVLTGIGGTGVAISIYGGETRATSISAAANSSEPASINIYGGTAISTGSITADSVEPNGTSYLNINGGTVIAKNMQYRAYAPGSASTLNINTGGSSKPVVLAESIAKQEDNGGACTYKGPSVSAGTDGILDGLNIAANGSTFIADSGAITFASTGLTVPEGGVLKVPAGWTIDLGTNAITNYGTIYAKWNGGAINGGGRIIQGGNYGSITGQAPSASVNINLTNHEISGPGANYEEGEHLYTISANGSYTVTGETTADHIFVDNGLDNVRITLDNASINIGNASPLDIGENSTVTLLLAGSNLLKIGDRSALSPAINVDAARHSTLIIDSAASNNAGVIGSSDHKLSGTLRAVANESDGAAIGGAGVIYIEDIITPTNACSGGDITILGGTIIANSTYAAGIGGGKHAYGNKEGNTGGNGGNVLVDGGIVIAGNQYESAGIGGAFANENGGNGGSLTVNGGLVAAFSWGSNGTGIGGGANAWSGGGSAGSGGTIEIKGGTVIALSNDGLSGIGGGKAEDGGANGSPAEFSGESDFNTSVVFASSIDATTSPTGSGLLVGSVAFTFTYPTWNGTTFENGVITLANDFTVPSGASLIIPPGWTLNTAGHNLGNNGTIYYNSGGSTVTPPNTTVTGTEYGTITNTP